MHNYSSSNVVSVGSCNWLPVCTLYLLINQNYFECLMLNTNGIINGFVTLVYEYY